ncbi:MAG: hypothetical protein M1827_005327 [Pycnora praestabilis]|nr:MAG: hypothetical protein M1827_005327 [Pycnora praestabilis]
MTTPHRGLPPPSAMTLPAPDRGPPPIGQPMGQLPAPPSQWQGAEESMRNWLQAKAEEDKRKQEEEKTHQESLRLEQRKIEQSMLRDSLSGGVPPYMVPMVFAGMGGGNLANASLEWTQHYLAQVHQLQQQQAQQQQQQQQQLQHQALPPSQSSPELRRETRLIAHPYGPSQQQTQSQPGLPPAQGQQGQQGQQLVSQPPQPPTFQPPYQLSPSARARAQQGNIQVPAPTSAPRPPPQSTLPRLNTGELQIQPPPQGASGMQIAAPGQSMHPLQQSQSAQQSGQQQDNPSPSIYFHHWVPPNSQAGSGSNQPNTPSGKSHDSPYQHNPGSHLSGSEYASSPKKRKAQGPQQAAPPPSAPPHYTSPPFSQTASSTASTPSGRRRGHSRNRSDASSRGLDSSGRPVSRQRQSDVGSAPGSGQTSMSERQQPSPAATTSEDRGAGPPPGNYDPETQQQQQQQHRPAGSEMRREHESTTAPGRETAGNGRQP